jgi:hypothetical protein
MEALILWHLRNAKQRSEDDARVFLSLTIPILTFHRLTPRFDCFSLLLNKRNFKTRPSSFPSPSLAHTTLRAQTLRALTNFANSLPRLSRPHFREPLQITIHISST